MRKLNIKGFTHDFIIIFIVVIFAIAGVAYLVFSRAATTTYTSTNDWGNWQYVKGSTVTTDLTHSNTGELLLQFNQGVTTYHNTDTAYYQYNLPANTTASSITFTASYADGGYDTVFLAAGSPTNIVWQNNTAANVTNQTFTYSLANNPTTVYFGIKYSGASGGFGGNTPANRNLIISNYTLNGITTTASTTPTVTLSANPTSINSGTSSTLSWTSTNATSCNLSGPITASEPTSGSLSTGNLTANSTYTMTCSGSGGSASSSTTVTVNTGSGGTGGAICGSNTGTPQINKFMVIWEENTNYSSIIGNTSGPYMNSLASNCGLATNQTAITHPSLPNYMSTTSGVSYAYSPWNGDCLPTQSSCTTSNASIFSQLGTNWKSYNESMPSNCYKSTSGEYAPKHNPATYYTNISSACSSQDVPLGSTTSGTLHNDLINGLPAFSTITPNLINDMHDGTISNADSFLKTWIPAITAANDYKNGHLAILIVWDEGSGSGNYTSHVAAIMMSAFTPKGTLSSTSYNDYSILRTAEDLTGKSAIGNASSANSMVSAFHLK